MKQNKVSWKEDVVDSAKRASTKDLYNAIKDGNLIKALDILYNLDYSKKQKFFFQENRICWFFKIINNYAKQGIYNSIAFKEIVLILSEINIDLTSSSFLGFTMHLRDLRKAGKAEEDYINLIRDDYLNAMKAKISSTTRNSSDLSSSSNFSGTERTSAIKAEAIDSHKESMVSTHQDSYSNDAELLNPSTVFKNFYVKKNERHKDNVTEEKGDNNLLSIEYFLKNIYSWLNELPAHIKKYFLGTHIVKSIIENAKHIAAIYNLKNIKEDITSYEAENKSSDDEDNFDLNVRAVVDYSSTKLIDTDMLIHDYPAESFIILPMLGIDAIYGSNFAFNQLDNFNMLNNIAAL